MQIEFDCSLNGVDWNEVSSIFEQIGWGKREPDRLKQAFEASSVVCFAKAGGVVVGFGRSMTDNQFYATILDLIVRKEYQRKGIGMAIMQKLLDMLPGPQFVQLTSMPGKEDFYKQFGFRIQKTAMLLIRTTQAKS